MHEFIHVIMKIKRGVARPPLFLPDEELFSPLIRSGLGDAGLLK